MDDNEGKLTLKVSGNHDEEIQMLFAYVYSSNSSTNIPSSLDPSEQPLTDCSDHKLPAVPVDTMPVTSIENDPVSIDTPNLKQMNTAAAVSEVDRVISRLRTIVGLGKYTEKLRNKIILNMVDVGGQPGFLEMLPFLSKGPGMFLTFFRLDKAIDEPCEVTYERGNNKITPYRTTYTIQETLSQILSAINYHVALDMATDQVYKCEDLAYIRPVVTLVGTFKDKLKLKVLAKALQDKLSTEFPQASQMEMAEVIKQVQNGQLKSGNEPTDVTSTDMHKLVTQLLSSEAFKKELQEKLCQELEQKNNEISSITHHFEDLLFPTEDNQQFIGLDNFTGDEADIDPLRQHLQDMFENFFSDAQLRIRPTQLFLGVVLRKEYDIVSVDDCILIGKALGIDEEKVKFTVWYLDRWVGTLIYHPEIDDDWFKQNIICNPQIVFDSISSLIIESLLELRSPKDQPRRIKFKPAERKNWIEKGQFSLDTVKRCHSKCIKDRVKQGQLIPVEKLLKFLEYSNLLSQIKTKKEQGTREIEEIMYFIPAILECASPDELAIPPPNSANTPSPIKITFKHGHVPIGVFCAMISQLVSKGSDMILGMNWELVEFGVKRNLISFHVGTSEHIVTLISQATFYEIRVNPCHQGTDIHELCSYVLSTVLFVMKGICKLIKPIITFDCQCDEHKIVSHFCYLRGKDEKRIYFKCDYGAVNTLTKSQEYWFTKEVKIGECVYLSALPYIKGDPGFSFKWSRNGGSCNELKLGSIRDDHCTGFYTCEIADKGKYLFSVHHCLKSIGSVSASPVPLLTNKFYFEGTDQLPLEKFEATIKEICSDWYSLAVELEISHRVRKSIERDYSSVEGQCMAMLQHWVRRVNPLPTWSALVSALKPSALDRKDIAKEIEKNVDHDVTLRVVATSLSPQNLGPQGPLDVNEHLKTVREATWDVRSEWQALGLQLGVSLGTLQAIEHDYNKSENCFTRMLEHWLLHSTPPATWSTLIQALRSPPLKYDYIANNIDAKCSKLSP